MQCNNYVILIYTYNTKLSTTSNIKHCLTNKNKALSASHHISAKERDKDSNRKRAHTDVCRPSGKIREE